MIVNGKTAGTAEKFFSANGVEVNVISHFICSQNNVAFQSSGYCAEMANALKQAHSELTIPAEVQLGFYTEKAHFAVSHLER